MDWVFSTWDALFCAPKWYIGATFGASFFVYYLCQAVKQPITACSRGKFREFLEKHVPLLQEKYWPTLWCFEARVHTIVAWILRSSIFPDITYRREILCLSDGGEVGLDWLEDGCIPRSPIVVILPGLTGESQADYVKCFVNAANRIGLRIVVFINRGLGGVPLKTARTYCALSTDDLSEVILHVKSLNPDVPLGAVGVSMGGLILGNYLASEGKGAREHLAAAMLVSVPWNVYKATESIEKYVLNRMINNYLCRCLLKTAEEMKRHTEDGPWNWDEVFKSKTIRDFDSSFVSKQFGFKDVQDYYTKGTMHDKVHKIAVPVLCLNAADDPFQPLEGIPTEAANASPNVAIVVTARGGHIGFMEGLLPSTQGQYMDHLFSQFFGAVFKHSAELQASIDS